MVHDPNNPGECAVPNEADDNGRPKMPAERMLRIYFLQQWFSLSDPGAEEALYDSASIEVLCAHQQAAGRDKDCSLNPAL